MNEKTPETPSKLPWTGERMVPLASDPATQMYHWQRYQFFRPWYLGVTVIDAASGEGYGTDYAATFARLATGYDISDEAVQHSVKRYPHSKFEQADVCEVDYSLADLVVSFETIEHLPDPVKFLQALATCKGRIVISTPNRKNHSPGNKLEDKPHNPHHTVEWTPFEFAEIIKANFPGRQVRFLSQAVMLPGYITEGLDDEARYCIAVIGDGELPKWPKIGYAIPTMNNWNQLCEAIQQLCNTYPGESRFAITANGCDEQTLKAMRHQQEVSVDLIDIIEEPENRGYGVGSNLALNHLVNEGWCDYYAVVNDDVIPSTDCVCQMMACMQELERANMKPGVVVPMSNAVAGHQQVDIGHYTDYASLLYRAEQYNHVKRNNITQVIQARGLFMLIHPDCLKDVGGFDPIYGIGNFEDDDHNLRCRLAGYTLWMAEGAFLHHHGSTTFKKLNVDYEANINRNMAIFIRKWGLNKLEDWVSLRQKPEGVSIHCSLGEPAFPEGRFQITLNGEKVDLINQASEIEFAGWVLNRIQSKGPEIRRAVIEVIEGQRISA
ncbi:MAG TPA: methyltransferase domain-containing protein [Fimbriimonadaceae bacterium]|jgi:GT2 family glycosyltransferase